MKWRQHYNFGIEKMVNKNNDNKGYLIGRIAAVVQSLTDMPLTLLSKISCGPLIMVPWMMEACPKARIGGFHDAEFGEIMDKLDRFPTMLLPHDRAEFWLGYEHERMVCYNHAKSKGGSECSQENFA